MLSGGAGNAQADTPKELQPFQGKWQGVSFHLSGEKVYTDDELTRQSLEVSGDKMTEMVNGMEINSARLVLNTRQPGHIDAVILTGHDQGKTLRGIYRLENNQWTICFGQFDSDRPTEFTSPQGSGHRLIVLKHIP
jgi:uncharacterized protein (TIGR03067 family)